jgi:hypothetical protein
MSRSRLGVPAAMYGRCVATWGAVTGSPLFLSGCPALRLRRLRIRFSRWPAPEERSPRTAAVSATIGGGLDGATGKSPNYFFPRCRTKPFSDVFYGDARSGGSNETPHSICSSRRHGFAERCHHGRIRRDDHALTLLIAPAPGAKIVSVESARRKCPGQLLLSHPGQGFDQHVEPLPLGSLLRTRAEPRGLRCWTGVVDGPLTQRGLSESGAWSFCESAVAAQNSARSHVAVRVGGGL